MDGSATNGPSLRGSGRVRIPRVSSPLRGTAHVRIKRVSSPWPVRTKEALRTSLDRGIFENIHAIYSSGPDSMEQSIHFAGAVDETVRASISRRKS